MQKFCSSEEHNAINAMIYCQNCNVYMCNKCEMFHAKLCKNHKTFKLEKITKIYLRDFAKKKDIKMN